MEQAISFLVLPVVSANALMISLSAALHGADVLSTLATLFTPLHELLDDFRQRYVLLFQSLDGQLKRWTVGREHHLHHNQMT